MFKLFEKCRILLVLISFFLIIYFVLLMVKPKIKLKNDNIILEYGEEYVEDGYKATYFGFDISDKISIKSNLNINKLGKYKIVYSYKTPFNKSSKTKNIEVVDTTIPKISISKESIFLTLNEDLVLPEYSAFDNYDGNITDQVKITNNVNSKIEGEYEILFEVIDSSNNKAIVKLPVMVKKDNAKSVPIIAYHHFMSKEERQKYAPYDKYIMDTELFEKELKYLKDNGYNSITLDDFYKWYTGQIPLTNKDFVLTIDDGNISSYIYAMPLIEKYGFNAIIFVITNRIKAEEQVWDPQNNKFLDQIKIDDIIKNHKSIALESHTDGLHMQSNGNALIHISSDEVVLNDFIESKKKINANYLAFPYGANSSSSAFLLKKAGYKMAFGFGGVNNRKAMKSDDQYFIPRININSEVTLDQFIRFMEV